MTIHLHHNDLPAGVSLGSLVAVDCEMMGLVPQRDRLCLIQLSAGDGDAHLVKFDGKDYAAPNLKKILTDPAVEKIFHFGRTDFAVIKYWLGVRTAPIFDTKIASRLCRTYTDKHGMKDLIKEMLGVEFTKGAQQTSHWGVETLSEDQKTYAADDVLYLHRLREKLVELLEKDGRMEYARACFDFLPLRAEMDLLGWGDELLRYLYKPVN